MSASEMEDRELFLSTSPARRIDRRLALAAVLISSLLFVAAVPFAKLPLAQVWAFIPAYQSALAINDLITAVLLFAQFSIVRRSALVVLACGYLFTALMAVVHMLSFPGVFAPGGVIGGGAQTTAWLYMFWHGGFPLAVVYYACARNRDGGAVDARHSVPAVLALGVASTIVLAGVSVLIVTAGHDYMPPVMIGIHYTTVQVVAISVTWLLCIVALVVLWLRRPHSVLDLWLIVVMCAWVFDIALSGVLNAARYDLGFYSGRLYGLLAATFVLVVLLSETSALYARLSRTYNLKLSAAQLINQRIFETSVDLILVVGRAGDFIRVSPSSLPILGYRPEEMVGRNGAAFLYPDDLEKTREQMRQGRRLGTPRNFECRYLHKNGKAVTLAWTGVWSPQEQQHFFIGRDMTERQAMEQQLRQSQKLEAIGQLTGGVAHDFNNLLGVVIGNLDLVLETADAKREETHYLKSALEAAMRGADLVRRLMMFSRRQPLSPSVFAVNEAIGGFEPLLRRVLGETIALQTQLGAEAGRIAADKHQLENALMNLCVNSRDAMPSGGLIRIETAAVAVDAASAPLYPDITPGRYVTIAVTDNGAGIAPEHLARVFEPFFTTKAEGKGTGLGLSMVYGFMRESNGMAKIYSEPGHGTTVRLYFPATEAEVSESADTGGAVTLPTGDETVLVVEDRVDMRAVAVAVLERLGYRALEADTAAAALAVLNSGAKVDLVFSDIVMPGGMSGLDLARELRGRGLKAPVLLTSGYASPQLLREQARKMGVPVIGKPYRVADLAAKVRAMLDGKNGNGGNGGGAAATAKE